MVETRLQGKQAETEVCRSQRTQIPAKKLQFCWNARRFLRLKLVVHCLMAVDCRKRMSWNHVWESTLPCVQFQAKHSGLMFLGGATSYLDLVHFINQ